MSTATATVKGGFWPEVGVLSLSSTQGSGYARKQIARLFGTKGLMDERELAETLNGVVAGSAAVKTLARVANSSELGGVRAIESETIINRNTTAADVTALNADFFSFSTKTTLASPANKDGNPLGTR
jgi:hypothetical protein